MHALGRERPPPRQLDPALTTTENRHRLSTEGPQSEFQLSIYVLHARGWSWWRNVGELGIHRKTVASFVDRAKASILTTGSAELETTK